MSRPYVIVGNSAAALGGIEGIRSMDGDKPITLIAKETEPIYSRPLISYWLAGKVSDAEMYPVSADFYDTGNIEAMGGAEVVAVDAAARCATLADGRTIEFDRLLIAGGGTPIVPPEPDVGDLAGVSTFTCWGDAVRVKQWLDRKGVTAGVVVGGGFIGIKAAEALVDLGIEATIVELSDRIMPAAFDDVAGEMAVHSLRSRGVGVCRGVTVKAARGVDGHLAGVTLSDGTPIDCQLLLLAIEVRPNTAFIAGSGLDIDRGLCVNDRMETSAEGIYAAGDIAQGLDRITGAARSIPILRNARKQGRVAGANMAGGDEVFRGGVAMNSTDVFGLPCISIGLTNPPEDEGFETVRRRAPGDEAYIKLVYRGNTLVGALCVGAIERAGVLRHLIEEGIDVSACRGHLLTDNFPLDVLPVAYWQNGRVMEW